MDRAGSSAHTMAVDVTADLAGALAARLGMQISLSAMPVVEEWMDAALDRWLDHVPFPGELPAGSRSRLAVALASDLSRLTWRAFGPAEGFVPRLAEYLAQCGASFADVDRLNEIGVRLAPDTVGSWIRVESGRIDTGWELCDPRPASAVAEFFGSGVGAARLRDWIAAHGIQHCRRVARAVGVNGADVELAVAAADLEGAIGVASAAFRDLAGRELPPACKRALLAVPVHDLALAVRLVDGDIVRLALVAANPLAATRVVAAQRETSAGQVPADEQQRAGGQAESVDLLQSLCAAVGSPYEAGIQRVCAALACARPRALELAAVGDPDSERWLVEAHYAPHEQADRATLN